jgi:hypothetical protein
MPAIGIRFIKTLKTVKPRNQANSIRRTTGVVYFYPFMKTSNPLGIVNSRRRLSSVSA